MQNDFIDRLNVFSVLYVEDEDGIRNNIQQILEHLFRDTYTAKNVSEAFLKYNEFKPDLVITDIKMGVETGIDLIKKIRDTDSKTRIIITSAHTDLEYMLEVAELHLVRYIVKPITNEKLMNALEAFIKTHENEKKYVLEKDWLFDYDKAIIINNKKSFNLTKKESKFLKLLITKNRIITYNELENNIWEEDGVMTANAMRLFVKNFRKKLPENFLKNVQGTGYKILKD